MEISAPSKTPVSLRIVPSLRGALLRRAVARQPADGGEEVAVGVLGIDARLHGPAGELHVRLLQGELLAGRNPDHLLDEVEPGDELGDRMLDLQPRVHLQEIEGAVLAGDELDRAGAVVADGLGQRHGLLAHGLAGLGIEQRGRRLLDHLLVATLDGAFALAQVDDMPVLVAQHLDLDVPGVLDELLHEHAIVAEARLGLRAGKPEALLRLLGRISDAHALAAAACRGLDHDGVADLLGDLHGFPGVGDLAEVAGHGRHLGFRGCLLALDLVAHGRDRPGVGADEDDAGLLERKGERFTLRQEAVARMHRLGAGLAAGLHDLIHQEVGLGRGRRPDRDGLVGHLHVQPVAVGLRVDRHRLDAELLGRLDDPAGDLATVGDQDFLEHETVPPCRLRDVYSLPMPGRKAARAGSLRVESPCLDRNVSAEA